ncbi:glycosyltransferase involved in cell wall biosynthesis [Pseudomonas hunanensis]|uniref:Glycosyltransferase involved in cell wall biosynthesis n=1 Tax=Pseudomonas hunanensis TaxID=1247546 RepID=A0ACC6K6Z0_9PSED|nr:glycosyltransferase family 4 protein [Pseudomonas hunanensis]MDR6714142.1 glycosyltransferase involved in cell wall biosynthesis [Pseudomonas hunanensis]
MKFLLIASHPDSLLNFRGPLLDALRASGLQVHVAAPDLAAGSTVRAVLEAKGITVHDIALQRVGLNPLTDLRSLLQLWRLMRQIRPSHVMGYTVKPVVYGSIAAWLARVPQRFALITGLGYAFQEPEQKGKRGLVRRVVQTLYAAALRCTHKVFFQNPDDEALFRSLKLLPPQVPSCVVNGSGVDVASFAVAPLPDSPRFLLIARLLGDKGVREYAAAAQRMREQYPQASFALVGWIDDNPDAIAQHELDRWVAEGSLEYLGRLGDVRPAIEGCSVYVLPSYREGTPRTVLEAMAMGRPIITTDAPGCRETVVPEDNGMLVAVKSVEQLVEAMTRFVLEPELTSRMGRRSREMAAQRYDVHSVNAVMLAEMGIAPGAR